MKYSKQRNLILNILKEHPCHPTAESIFAWARQQDSSISLATVYRNLNQLAEHGIIKKLEHLGTTTLFDHTLTPHYHFICSKCSKVIDIDDKTAVAISDQLSERTGLTINEIDISLRGICKECLQPNKN